MNLLPNYTNWKFIGRSDEYFTNGKVYTLVKVINKIFPWQNVKCCLTTDSGDILCIPYSSEQCFYNNWEIVED